MKKIIVLFYIIVSLYFLPCTAGADTVTVGTMSGVLPQQIGSTRLVLVVRGHDLPRPEVKEYSNYVEILFKDTLIPSAQWSRDYDFPLLGRIEMNQTPKGLLMKLSTGQALSLSSIRGQMPANVINIQFSSLESKKRALAEKKMFAPSVKKQSTGDPFTSTKKISIDLRDVELKDVFRMLGQMMNMNIVLDPSVNEIPPLTMRFDNAPLNEVFGYLMRLYGMSYAKVGKTLIIGNPEAISKATGKEKTRIFDVSYAEIKDLPALLVGLSTIPKEKILVDSRLKRIYATGSDNQLMEFERALQRLDHPGRQVMLKARIIEINDNATDELETLLNAVYNGWWLNTNSSGGSAGYLYSDQVELDDFPNDDDRPSGFVPGSGADLSQIANGGLKMLDVGLNALVTKNDGKVLANPSVITISGKKASIKLVEKLKYISERDDAGNATYSDEEVGPKLEFTPVVGRDGIVSIEILISTGEVVSWKDGNQGETIPQTTEREVKTNVRVRNGEPFVVGGLFKETHSNSTTKIPILGDIPLLGELFKSKSKIDSRSEVVMIVIPYILDVSDGPVQKWDL